MDTHHAWHRAAGQREAMGEGSLYQVVTDKFVAGLVVKEGRVVQAAPILRWAIGKPLEELCRQIEQRGGTVTAVFAQK